jgi:hypothetical protein
MINSGFFAPKGTSQNVGFTKDKCAIYNRIKLGFIAARSCVSALECNQFFSIFTA